MNQNISRSFIALAAGLAIAAPASAADIDFDPVSTGTYSSLTVGAVSFAYLGGSGSFGVVSASPGYPISGNALLSSAYSGYSTLPFKATIAGGASSFSIGMGDYNADTDEGHLEAYDSSGSLLDSDYLFVDSSTYGGGMLSVSSSSNNIAYVYFYETGDYPGAVYWDNASYTTTTAPVPEPETYAMMLAGLGLLGVAARRRKQKAGAA